VLIAFLARGRLLAVGVAAFLFCGAGGRQLRAADDRRCPAIATIIQALIIVFLLAGDAVLAFRLRLARAPSVVEIATSGGRP